MKQTAAALTLALLIGLTAGHTLATASDHQPNRIAFLARADNPVDALAASAVAAQFGGVVLLTPPDRLGDEARDGLRDYHPDLVVLAGGTAALTPQVEEQVRDAGYETQRISGTTRTDTAKKVSRLLIQHRTHLRATFTGAIFMYPAQLTCPDGMTRYTPLDGAFARGGTEAEAGGTERHHHFLMTDTDLGFETNTGSRNSDPIYDRNTFDDPEQGSFHSHHIEADTLTAPNLPPYANVRYCQM